MKSIANIVYEAFNEITGLEVNDLEKINDTNLFENGILDSLSLVNLLSLLEEKTCKNIEVSKCQIKDFNTIISIINLIENV